KKNTQRAEELFKMKAIAERDWDTQRAQLDQLAARRSAAAAAVASAELDLDYAHVRSPITGHRPRPRDRRQPGRTGDAHAARDRRLRRSALRVRRCRRDPRAGPSRP